MPNINQNTSVYAGWKQEQLTLNDVPPAQENTRVVYRKGGLYTKLEDRHPWSVRLLKDILTLGANEYLFRAVNNFYTRYKCGAKLSLFQLTVGELKNGLRPVATPPGFPERDIAGTGVPGIEVRNITAGQNKRTLTVPDSNPEAKPRKVVSRCSVQDEVNAPLDLLSEQAQTRINDVAGGMDRLRYASTSTSYAYYSEGFNDGGWGCAWRAIQTCLSFIGVPPSFEELYNYFGQAEVLQDLWAKTRRPAIDIDSCAPHKLASGWAEPLIGAMVLRHYGCPYELYLVNGRPGNAHAPREVFPDEPLGFAAFKGKLTEHFRESPPCPVMIDDGTYAMNIIGVKEEHDKGLTLLISDPHINPGVGTLSGIYAVTLDENGRQISHTGFDANKTICPISVLNFGSKGWMVLFP